MACISQNESVFLWGCATRNGRWHLHLCESEAVIYYTVISCAMAEELRWSPTDPPADKDSERTLQPTPFHLHDLNEWVRDLALCRRKDSRPMLTPSLFRVQLIGRRLEV